MNNPFEFDLDSNDILNHTKDNVERINFIIENDSNYRIFEDASNRNSIKYLIKNNSDASKWDECFIEKLIIGIDVQNSTHQDSTGIKKGSNGGRKKTAKYIYEKWSELLPIIQLGNPQAVNIIAKSLLKYDPDYQKKPEDKGRYTFSFASKFCTYVSNALYEANKELYSEDSYSIYDNVLCDVLPYYAWEYLGTTEYISKTKSNITRKFGGEKNDKGDYAGYLNLIDDIRKVNKDRIGFLIKRKDFDHLLWYYFKGDKDIFDDNNKFDCLHKSRITISIEKIIHEKTV